MIPLAPVLVNPAKNTVHRTGNCYRMEGRRIVSPRAEPPRRKARGVGWSVPIVAVIAPLGRIGRGATADDLLPVAAAGYDLAVGQ